MLSKQQILAVQDLKLQVVSVPEWGGDVNVKMLSAAEREEITALWLTHEKASDATKLQLSQDALLIRCLVDEHGKQLFEPTELAALKAKSASAIDRIVKAAMVLNAMSGGATEDAAKNSAGGQTASSSSDSPANSAAPLPSSASA